MKRFAPVLLALILIQTMSVFGAQDPTEWIKYDSPEGRYSVLLPSQPKLSTQESAAATGDKLTQYLAMVSDEHALYLIAYFDLAPGTFFSLDKARDGMVQAVPAATLVSEGSITLRGAPGRELKISFVGPDKVEYLVYGRIVEIGGRAFVAQYIIGKSDDDAVSTAKAAKYFESITFTIAPAKAP